MIKKCSTPSEFVIDRYTVQRFCFSLLCFFNFLDFSNMKICAAKPSEILYESILSEGN